MIVTGRARWIIVLCVCSAVLSLTLHHVLLFRVALTLLMWIGLEWAAFRYRCDLYLSRAKIERSVQDRQGEARVLWATRSAQVTTKFSYDGGWLGRIFGHWQVFPSVRSTVHDLLPTAVQLVDGDNGAQIKLGVEPEFELDFQVKAAAPGMVRFNGLRFVIEDAHGLFLAERFLYLPHELRVMPLAMDMGTVNTIRKRANVLPPPGLHTVQKAGPGSELMEIREYQPGDPPRSIAWKVSARRNELMCKQFESEVPVRCQLLVDMSRIVRLGYPGPCLGGQLVSIASSIAFTLTGYRDPVGISLFDGDKVRIIRPSASRRATLRAVDTLCEALDEPIDPVDIPPAPFIRSGFDLARMRYPHAMQYAEQSLASIWPARSITRLRRRLAAVLANHYGMEHHAMGELEGNDRAMSYWLQRFHAEHGAPFKARLVDDKGKYLFDDRKKISQLAQLLRRSASQGRDNELFVILAELTDADYDLTPLTEAIKYAKARHHRVAVLMAWPPGMTGPDSTVAISANKNIDLFLSERRHQQDAYKQLRAELGKLGVPMAAAAQDAATAMVMNQLEIIRTGRSVA